MIDPIVDFAEASARLEYQLKRGAAHGVRLGSIHAMSPNDLIVLAAVVRQRGGVVQKMVTLAAAAQRASHEVETLATWGVPPTALRTFARGMMRQAEELAQVQAEHRRQLRTQRT